MGLLKYILYWLVVALVLGLTVVGLIVLGDWLELKTGSHAEDIMFCMLLFIVGTTTITTVMYYK